MRPRRICQTLLVKAALFAGFGAGAAFAQQPPGTNAPYQNPPYGSPRAQPGAQPNSRTDPRSKSTGDPKVAASFHGKLKIISGSEIVIETDEGQTFAIFRQHKTKFLKANKSIKPSEIAAGTLVTVNAMPDIDLKPVAMEVVVDKQEAKKAEE